MDRTPIREAEITHKHADGSNHGKIGHMGGIRLAHRRRSRHAAAKALGAISQRD